MGIAALHEGFPCVTMLCCTQFQASNTHVKKITYIGQMGVKKTHFLKVQVKFTWGGWNQAHFECVSVNNTSTEEVM